ncbi:MAG TPA: energy transducer TonB [Janthinobacterium sp.]|nr:energy transducer TonB [Janthinobacterium sp.]
MEKKASWSGGCKDGYADGPGVLQWYVQDKPGDRYEGTMAKGMPDGAGVYFYLNHSSFKGEYKNGRRQGEGVFTYADGGKLVAMFEQGKIVGDVDRNFINGDRYHGEWHEGFNGKGSMVYAFGGSYEGQWLFGRPNGRGAIVYPGGARREGEFRDGVIVGSVGAGGDAAAAPAKAERFAVKQDDPDLGSAIRREQISGAEVPLEKSYRQLTPEQQHLVKSHYTILQEGDEPPYPLYGPVSLEKILNKGAGKLRAEGELWMSVLIDAEGKPVSVAVMKSPDPELTRFAASAMMLEKYKPAVCAGKACAMSYPLHLTFSISRR